MSPELEKEEFKEPTPTPKTIEYDAAAKQRLPFDVDENGTKYDTAHIFDHLTDERFIQFLKEARIKGDAEDVEENELEITVNLWNDLVTEVENIEVEDGADWKSLIDSQEKADAMERYLAVAIVEEEEKAAGRRKLSAHTNETVITEAFFNGKPVQQTHRLEKKRDEWKKKYNRIQANRFQPEQTKGLRRSPKIKLVPQDENIGKLYDEQFIEQTGFVNGNIPLRFKTRVIHYLYGGSKLDDAKKS